MTTPAGSTFLSNRTNVIRWLAIAASGAVVVGMLLARLGGPETPAAPPTGQLVPTPKGAALTAGKDYPHALSKFMEKGGVLLATVNVGDGITGYLLEMEGQRSLVYGSPNGEVMMVGAVLGKDGESLTADHMKLAGLTDPNAAAPKVAANTDVTEKWPDIQKAAFGTTGKGDKTLFAFYEPHCGWCSKLVEAVGSRDITVKWIPVGFLQEDSGTVNAGFIREPDGTQYLHEWLAASAQRRSAEFLARVGAVSPDERSRLQYNNELMANLGIDGTPAILVRDASGKIEIVRGMPTPQQLDAIVARLPG